MFRLIFLVFIPFTNSSHRDDALRQTRQLQTEIQAEREALRGLINAL